MSAIKPEKDLVQEARELISKATPGPWAVWDSCSWRRIGTREPFADGNVICPIIQRDGHPDLLARREDLELAARAPELLDSLCDRVEAAEEDQKFLGDRLEAQAEVMSKVVAERNALRDERDGYQGRLFDECRSAGWDPDFKNTFAEEIAHLHEELSEAFRAFRQRKDFQITIDANGKPQGVPVELADVLIGLFYNAELHGFDLFAAVELKHQYNLTRNYVAEGRQLHAALRKDEQR